MSDDVINCHEVCVDDCEQPPRCCHAVIVDTNATIQRVRELHYNTATHHPSGCCSECGGTYPCPTVRALDGDA